MYMSYFYDKINEVANQEINEALNRDIVRRFDKGFFIRKIEYKKDEDALYVTFRRTNVTYRYADYYEMNKHNEISPEKMLRSNASRRVVTDGFHELKLNGRTEYARTDDLDDVEDLEEQD